jgi:hypothetical protein
MHGVRAGAASSIMKMLDNALNAMTSTRNVSASFHEQSVLAIQTAPDEATNSHRRDLVKMQDLEIRVQIRQTD